MLLHINVETNLEYNSLMDLHKLKPFRENTKLKVNFSEIGRNLKVDRRTATKYADGFTKSKTRERASQFDEFYEIIIELLSDGLRLFAYKNNLYNYMKDNHDMPGASSSFRRYLSNVPEFDQYFKSKGRIKPSIKDENIIDKNQDNTTRKSVGSSKAMRYETENGEQAQIDWKESQRFTTVDGEEILVNVLVFLLSCSRFKLFHVSLHKTQDVLFHFLNKSFETIGGVPKTIVTDNMKTVMEESRTEYRSGKVNTKFQQFANDYGFKVHPCIAGRPQTKSKVETQMKIIDEIMAYNGHITYEELVLLLQRINERENYAFHPYYKKVPAIAFQKEKDFLSPLPQKKIRNHYSIKSSIVDVNPSSLFTYNSNNYSVLPEYIGKKVTIEPYDNKIYVYYNKKLITIHDISTKVLNYHENHYIEISKLTLPFDDEKIEEIARENLKKIGESFS